MVRHMIRKDITWDSDFKDMFHNLGALTMVGIVRRMIYEIEWKYGKEGQDFLKKVLRDAGFEFGWEALDFLGEDFCKEKGDVITAQWVCHFVDWVLGFVDEVTYEDKERDIAVVSCTYCPWMDREEGATHGRHHTPEDCASLRELDWGFMHATSPSIAFIPMMRLTSGLPYCEWLACRMDSEWAKEYFEKSGEGTTYPALRRLYKDEPMYKEKMLSLKEDTIKRIGKPFQVPPTEEQVKEFEMEYLMD